MVCVIHNTFSASLSSGVLCLVDRTHTYCIRREREREREKEGEKEGERERGEGERGARERGEIGMREREGGGKVWEEIVLHWQISSMVPSRQSFTL